MSISKSKILSAFIETTLPQEAISKDLLPFEQLILSKESVKPTLSSDSSKNVFNKAFITNEEVNSIQSNWRQKNQTAVPPHQYHNNNNVEFVRGGNFHPAEPQVKINIENLYNFNKVFGYPQDQPSFYLRNKIQNIFFGPISTIQIQTLYQSNKIDSNYELRPIDIFAFKDKMIFDFISLKELNNEKWEDIIIISPLLKYTIKEEEKKEVVEPVKEEPPKKEVEPIKEDIKDEPIKKDLSGHIADEGGKWEDPNKKKKKIRPGQKPTTSKPIGLDAEIKISSINSIPSTKKQEKPKQEEDILELLKPKTQHQPQPQPKAKVSVEKTEEDNEGFVQVSKGGNKKGKKKKRPQEATIDVGFKY